jgi:hypothetical protein
MGWLTLHSIAAAYPANPSELDKTNTRLFLDIFTDTITCRFCKDHFYRIHGSYRSQYPDYLDSKQKFFLFTIRAHNDVNRSLDKPLLTSVSDCIASLKNATSVTSCQTFKDSYLSYLVRTWAHEMTGDALIYKSKSITMRELLSNIDLSNGFNIELEEEDVVSFRLSAPIKSNAIYRALLSAGPVGFSGGKLRLR